MRIFPCAQSNRTEWLKQTTDICFLTINFTTIVKPYHQKNGDQNQ